MKKDMKLKTLFIPMTFQILCATTFIFLGMVLGINSNLSLHQDHFYENILISGIDVSHKTPAEAINEIETSYLSPLLGEKITLLWKDKSFILPINQLITSSNIEAVISAAYDYTTSLTVANKLALMSDSIKKDFLIEFIYDEEFLTAFLDSTAEGIYLPPKNATVTVKDGTPTIIPHQNGSELNINSLFDKIKTVVHEYPQVDLSLDLTDFITETSPEITTAMLSPINAQVTSISTQFQPNSGKSVNIDISSGKINQILLMPGDTFSYYDTVGPITKEAGFQEGPVIINSKVVNGVGGGICQVSSTLYAAILELGMKPSTRIPHSRPVNYLPLGLDATFDYGNIDFKFINTLPYPLFIEAFTDYDTLFINLYSDKSLKNKDFRLKSDILEVITPPVQYIPDNNLPSGKKQLVQSGQKGYKVKVTRELFENDLLQTSEVVSYDTYKAVPEIYKLGP